MKISAIHLKHLILLLVFLLAVSCGGQGAGDEPAAEEVTTEETAEEAVEVQTVVVVATPTPELAEAKPQTSSDPAVEEAAEADSSSEETAVSSDAPVVEAPPVAAGEPTMTTLIDLNIRSGPGTNYTVLGVLRQGTNAAIVGKSPNGHWWKIACLAGVGSECWASAGAQYSVAENADGVQVAAVPPAPTHAATTTQVATHTPTYTPTGTTDPDITPSPTATTDANATATYTPTPTEEGAATATATATPPVGATATSTATATATATEAAQEASFDNDSLQNPAVSVFFSPTGTHNFSHSNDVSYENGDQDDWVGFEFPNNSNISQPVWLTLDCTISGDPGAQLRATLYEDGNATTQIAICNQGQAQLTVDNTKTQQVRIHFGITKPDIYATYTLTVVGFN